MSRGASHSRNSLCRESIHLWESIEKSARSLQRKFGALTTVDDLLQAGVEGYLEARERFDEGGGASLKTFAQKRIRGAMLDHIRGRFPAKKNGDGSSIVIVAIEDHPEITNLSDGECPLDCLLREETRRAILRAMECLTERDRLIVSLRFYRGLTLSDIAELLDVSEASISMRIKSILECMANDLREENDYE